MTLPPKSEIIEAMAKSHYGVNINEEDFLEWPWEEYCVRFPEGADYFRRGAQAALSALLKMLPEAEVYSQGGLYYYYEVQIYKQLKEMGTDE